jgi:predicted ATPase
MVMDTMKNRKSLMKSIIILSLLVVFMSGCSSHKSVASLGDVVIYSNDSVTTKAEFPGGTREFNKYVRLYLQYFCLTS